jgi:hypothetical protein
MGVRIGVALAATLLAASAARAQPSPEDRFREANDLVRGGDYPKAIALYGEIAAAGAESASLYWNWAQAARARGAVGEALWALLRARELEPGDRAVLRELEKTREAAALDPAEIAPDPLSAVARFGRRFRLDLLSVGLLALSVVGHVLSRLTGGSRGFRGLAATAAALALGLGAAPAAGSFAPPTGVVVLRGAPLLDAASPTAEAVGALREGEVVPILEASGEYVRVEDSSGARGWALGADVRRLDAPR